MSYKANVEFKFDSSYEHTYGADIPDDYFLPEEHFTIKAPAADLNIQQYFKLFEKFMLGIGMSPSNIRLGALSLVFSDWVNRGEQVKACKEYDLTMNEDLPDKFKQWKKEEEEIDQIVKNTQNVVDGCFNND
jgi:hypothetical protein